MLKYEQKEKIPNSRYDYQRPRLKTPVNSKPGLEFYTIKVYYPLRECFEPNHSLPILNGGRIETESLAQSASTAKFRIHYIMTNAESQLLLQL
jgi:hypothetical protein